MKKLIRKLTVISLLMILVVAVTSCSFVWKEPDISGPVADDPVIPSDTVGGSQTETERTPSETGDSESIPSDDSTEESNEPSEPTDTSEESTSKLEEPTSKPEKPTSKPEEPTSKPEEPTSKPEEPTSKPEEPTSKPEEPTSKPEEPTSKPEEPTSKPEEPTSKPEEPTSKPEEPTSKPEEPTSKPSEPEETKPEPHVHSYSSKTIAPTCTEKGYTLHFCKCGDEYKDTYVDAKGHTIKYDEVAPTCGASGVKSGYCSVCGWQDPNIVTLPATGKHTYGDWYVDTPATTTSTGLEKRRCSGCGKTEERSIPKVEVKPTDFEILPGNTAFGYDSLDGESNATGKKSFYKDLAELCKSFNSDFTDKTPTDSDGSIVIGSLDYAKYSLTSDQMRIVVQYFILDNPRYYWLSGTYKYTATNAKICLISDYASGAKRRQLASEIEGFLADCKTAVSSMKTSYEKALYIHDLLIKRIDYKYKDAACTIPADDADSHNIIGMVTAAGGVCEAYSKSFQMVMSYIGIDCINIVGEANGAHAWNSVKLDDGKWYYVDVTWDDDRTIGKPVYYCFGTKRSEFEATHKLSSSTSLSMFKYTVPQDEVSLTPMLLYKGNTLVGRYGTFKDAFDAMTDINGEYTIELLSPEINSNDYVIDRNFPTAKSIRFVSGIVMLDGGSFYRRSLYLGSNINTSADLVFDSIEVQTVTGEKTLDLGNYKLTLTGTQVTVSAGVMIKGNTGSVIYVSSDKVVALNCNVNVDAFTINAQTQVFIMQGTYYINRLVLGNGAYFMLYESRKCVLDVKTAEFGQSSRIDISGNVGHSVTIGNMTGSSQYAFIQITNTDLAGWPTINITGTSSIPVYFCFTNQNITSYTGIILRAQSLNSSNVYFFILNGNQFEQTTKIKIVNGDARVV